MARAILTQDRLDTAIEPKIGGYHAETIAEVQAAVAANRIVVVGVRGNPHVKWARKALNAAVLPFRYMEYGSYTSQWHRRLALKMWSGWPTFPMVFVDGVLIGGNSDLKKKLSESAL